MLFSPPLLLDVPVMARVRKYLLAHYPNGIVLEPTDARLFQLWMLVQTEKVTMRNFGRVPKPLSDTVMVLVRQTTDSRRKVLLNGIETKMVNKMIDLMIYQEFYTLAESNRLRGIGILATIRAFTDRYDFSEEDLAESTLREAYFRHRKGGYLGFSEPQLQGSAVLGQMQSDLFTVLAA